MSAVSLAKEQEQAVSAGPARVERAGGLWVARAELVLARPDHRPLAAVGLDPDPLGMLASAFARVRTEKGEEAELLVDVVPVSGEKVARRRRRLLARARRRGPVAFGERVSGSAGGGGVSGVVAAGLSVGGASTAKAGSVGRSGVPRTADLLDGVGKFVPKASVFAVQVLVRVTAAHPVRARARLHEVLAVLDVWTGENWWRPVGPRWAGWRPYSSVWWRRRSFDLRAERGDFAPARRQWVTSEEIAGLMKPATVRCAASNVVRCGGVVPPAPADLPTWTGQRDVVPLGVVTGVDGAERLGGMYARDLLFGASLGKSGFGKTEMALVQFIARAYAGDGGLFVDPHRQAMLRARPYLTHPAVAERLWEIDLTQPTMDKQVASWNPLSMEGRRIEDVQEVVGAVVGGISTAQGWEDRAPRARTILSIATRSLAELSHRLVLEGRPDLQPTVFQIRSLLMDDAWRDELLPHLSAETQRFWHTTFPKYDVSATPTVTYALDRLENSLSTRAFLGSPQGSYDVRRAMDDGKVVFVAPSGTGEADSLITSLLLFDLFRAGLSRPTPAPGQKLRTLWASVDELTAVDGSSNGTIPQILEQLRKFEVRLLAATQMVMRLSGETRQALMQNQSVLSATGADWDEASFLARRMPGIAPETITGLDRFEYLVTTQIRGRRSMPFRVRGVPVDEVYADYYDPEGVSALQEQIDVNLERRSVGSILKRQAALDEDICAYFAGRGRRHTDGGAGTDVAYAASFANDDRAAESGQGS